MQENKTTEVRIINLWWSMNYGACLTAYSLQVAVAACGYQPKHVHYMADEHTESFPQSITERFATGHLHVTQLIHAQFELHTLNHEANIFIVGSDQVWRDEYTNWDRDTYFLGFADDTKKIIAAAASFGTYPYEGDPSTIERGKHYLSRFDAIATREASGVAICRDTFGVEAVHTLDPVFWVELSTWEALGQESEYALPAQYLAAYVLDDSEEMTAALEQKAGELGLPLVRIKGVEVVDFVRIIKDCDYFITDSFHGACFAILFGRQFVCLANINRGLERFNSLFTTFGLMNRLVFDCDAIADFNQPEIDYPALQDIIRRERAKGMEYLKDALEMPIKQRGWHGAPLQIKHEFDIILLKKELAEAKRQLYLISNPTYRTTQRFPFLKKLKSFFKRTH